MKQHKELCGVDDNPFSVGPGRVYCDNEKPCKIHNSYPMTKKPQTKEKVVHLCAHCNKVIEDHTFNPKPERKKLEKLDPRLQQAAKIINDIYMISHAEQGKCSHPDWEEKKYEIIKQANP